jgi:type II secretory pathway pseudopilin PulG
MMPHRNQSGFGLVDVLVASLVAGVAIVGIALLFGSGSAWVSLLGEDRVALGLAEQRIEVLRDGGWRVTPADWAEANEPAGTPGSVAVGGRSFRRTTCVQYVDPATPAGLGEPAHVPACPMGTATGTVRITVTVEQADQPRTDPVTLQAWLTESGR